MNSKAAAMSDTPKFKEYDVVRLVRDVADTQLRTGLRGTILHVYPEADVYEVELRTCRGTVVETLTVSHLELVPAAEPEAEVFANAWLTFEDVLEMAPTLTQEQAENWLAHHEHILKKDMLAAGADTIMTIICEFGYRTDDQPSVDALAKACTEMRHG